MPLTARTLRALLIITGVVATVFGLLAVVTGVAFIEAAGDPGTGVDSELRYYAAWYVVAGLGLLRAARQPDAQLESLIIRGACGGLALGASGRVLGWITVGRPPAQYVALLIVEYVAAATLALLHSAVLGDRRARRGN